MKTEQHWGLRITDRLLHTSHTVDYGTDRANAIKDTAVTNPIATITVELVTRTATYTDWETAPPRRRSQVPDVLSWWGKR